MVLMAHGLDALCEYLIVFVMVETYSGMIQLRMFVIRLIQIRF